MTGDMSTGWSHFGHAMSGNEYEIGRIKKTPTVVLSGYRVPRNHVGVAYAHIKQTYQCMYEAGENFRWLLILK